MSAAFASDLDAMVSKADLWVHGHIHDSMDYRLGKARVVCNPLGYPLSDSDGAWFRENPMYDPNLVIEVGEHESGQQVLLDAAGRRDELARQWLSASDVSHQLEAILIVAQSDENLEDLVGDLSRYRIDGAISMLAVRSAKVAAKLEKLQIPVVAVNSRRFGDLKVVSTANLDVGKMAADALIERGCQRLLYMAGRDNPSQHDRESGFTKRARALGARPPDRVPAGFTYEEGYAAMEQVLGAGGHPDGVFCVNDLVAIGAMDALRAAAGLRVPEDVQVIGCDDIPMAGWQRIGLTTFVQDMSMLGRICVAALFDESLPNPAVVPSRLILRSTTVG